MYEQDHQPAFLEKALSIAMRPLNKISIAQFNKAKINIIITNPPYGASSPIKRYSYFKKNLKKDFKSNFVTTNRQAIYNLYLMAWFYSAYEVLKSNIPVIICMITPSS